MTAPPQPRRSRALVDTANPNSNNAAGFSSGRRKAINDRQRAAAEAEARYLAERNAMARSVWGELWCGE